MHKPSPNQWNINVVRAWESPLWLQAVVEQVANLWLDLVLYQRISRKHVGCTQRRNDLDGICSIQDILEGHPTCNVRRHVLSNMS